MSNPRTHDEKSRVDALWRARPRDRFLRTSLLILLVAATLAWWGGGLELSELASSRRAENLARFVHELRPFPLQGSAWSWRVAGDWVLDEMSTRGSHAALQTLALAIVAILLAGAAGALLSLPAARTFGAAEAFAPEGRPPGTARRLGLAVATAVSRTLLVFFRALPEYVWAFLLLAVFGFSAWPAILALAIHNAGILGRLYAEVIEDSNPELPAALRALGASRLQILATGLLPSLLPRFLLLLLYRWESCVREATVLGLLGVVSLGFWIEDARTRGHYDSLLLFVALGVAIIVLGDLVSSLARRWLRGA